MVAETLFKDHEEGNDISANAAATKMSMMSTTLTEQHSRDRSTASNMKSPWTTAAGRS